MCIDVVEIWLGTADGQISSTSYGVICPRHVRISFPGDNFSKYQWHFTKCAMRIDIVEIRFGIANGQISSILDRVI